MPAAHGTRVRGAGRSACSLRPTSGRTRTRDALRSGGLVDDVELRRRLEHFPPAREAGRNDEGVARLEGPLPAARVCDADAAARDVAELVLGVAHSPATRRAFPHAGEEPSAA